MAFNGQLMRRNKCDHIDLQSLGPVYSLGAGLHCNLRMRFSVRTTLVLSAAVLDNGSAEDIGYSKVVRFVPSQATFNILLGRSPASINMFRHCDESGLERSWGTVLPQILLS